MQKMIEKVASQGMIGNMGQYQNVAMVDAMTQNGRNGSGSSMGDIASQMAGMQMGMMMGQQMMNQMNNQMNVNQQGTGGSSDGNKNVPNFCPNCGTRTGGANFCPNCGTKLV